MNKRLNTVASILFGAAIGSAITWKYAKRRFEQIAQEEIDSVKEMYRNKDIGAKEFAKNGEAVMQGIQDGIESEDLELVEQIRKRYTGEEVKEDVEKPYVISPDEFGEFEDYSKISLSYYADGVLADENDELVDDVEEIVGFESLTHFGEYEEDSVFVRNDRRKCDYEILKDLRKFSDLNQRLPRH